MKTAYHWLETEVTRPGALLRFQYVLPSDAGTLTGVAPMADGMFPDGYARRGLLTLEALDRKLLLANLPVLAGGPPDAREDFYPVWETLGAGRLVNGNYLDGHRPNAAFAPYRLKIAFRTLYL